jgi:hypothetical protein
LPQRGANSCLALELALLVAITLKAIPEIPEIRRAGRFLLSSRTWQCFPKVPPDPPRSGANSGPLAANTLRAIPVIPEIGRRSLHGADLKSFSAAWMSAIDAPPTL